MKKNELLPEQIVELKKFANLLEQKLKNINLQIFKLQETLAEIQGNIARIKIKEYDILPK